ncbi:uncharacterized protein CMC5_075440 [Chondromyces crocatus]|uniref:Uncharacterized protein n=1 Tax=Chondromyces crocatus TaxID=52 RepID=A0A0K1ERM7_CHOCO|nr:uncharacterized protein CMC5_075440 [Chondromyces crocatus]
MHGSSAENLLSRREGEIFSPCGSEQGLGGRSGQVEDHEKASFVGCFAHWWT